MSYDSTEAVKELLKEITETGMAVRDRVNCLKNGLETIVKYGHKFQNREDIIEIARTTLEKYEKMP